MALFRCHKQDNGKSLLNASTPSSEIPSPFPSQHQSHQSQSNDFSNELSSSECLLRSVSKPSNILVRSTTNLPRQRRDRFQPEIESDAARYLSQFASQLLHTSSRTRRRPIASRSATSISTMTTASTVTSMTTSSAPSLIHTPASSLDVSAPVSPTRRSSIFSLHHGPSSYSCDAAFATPANRSANLVTPMPFSSDEGSIPASVPTIKIEAEKNDSTCYSFGKSEYKANSACDYILTAAASSMPVQSPTRRRNLSPVGMHAHEELVYNKQATSPKRDLVQGNLKQLLVTGTAQMSL